MARADTASASAHPDSIKGLAQSIAKPAYRRLLNAEPLLRRAVPVLIIAFLATICVGALVQVLDHRRQTLASEVLSLEAAADLASERLHRPLQRPAAAVEQPQQVLAQVLPSWAVAAGRRFILTNPDGVVAAATPATDATIGRRLIDVLGRHATAHDVWRGRGGHGNYATRQLTSAGDSSHAQRPVWSARRGTATQGRTFRMAFADDPDNHPLLNDRLRRPDPWICLSLASDAGAGSRPYLRNGPQSHRYRLEPWPLWPLGLGSRSRSHLLVAIDVRHPWA